MKQLTPGKQFLFFVSFFFASTLWFYVLNSEPRELEKKVGIAFILPEGKAIKSKIPKEVKLKLKGPQAFMGSLFRNGDKIFIDLKTKKKAGQAYNIHLTEGDIPLPFGVEVLDIEPRKFKISLEKELLKKVSVKTMFAGKVAKELRLMKHVLEPNNIIVSGPYSIVRRLSSISTVPIDLSQLEGEGKFKVNLESLDARVKSKERQVDFSYVVRPKKANLTLKNIPIRFLTSKRRFTPKSRSVSLDVLALDEKSGLSEKDIQVIADLPEGKKGVVKVKLRARLPDGVHLLKVHPEYVTVKLH